MIMTKKSVTLPSAAVAALWMTASTAWGLVPFSYSNDFSGPDGSMPENWIQTPEVAIMEIRNNTFFMRRDADLGSSGWARAIGYVGEGSELWADYTVETWFLHSRQQDAPDTQSIIARWQGNIPAFAEDGHGYMAQHRGESGGPGELQIVRDFVRSGGDPNILATVPLDESLEPDALYRLSFTLEGPALSAALYREDGVRIGEAFATDSTYETGSIGLRSRIGVNDRETFFDEVSVQGTAIPEPSAYALLFGGVVVLSACAVRIRRRRRTRAF